MRAHEGASGEDSTATTLTTRTTSLWSTSVSVVKARMSQNPKNAWQILPLSAPARHDPLKPL
eukprot:833394-Rhodomonas_salina.1